MLPTALRLILAIAVMNSAAFAEEWSKRFVISGKPELRVQTGNGSVTVRAWDRKEIEARVTTVGWKIAPTEVRVVDHQSGDRVDLEVRLPNAWFGSLFVRKSIRVEIQVPREIHSEIRTGDGSILVESLRGETYLSTGDGSINADSLDGTLDARTGDGSIRARGRFDVLTLHTGDGNVQVEVNRTSKMAFGWTIQTGDGSVTLRLPADFAADLDVHTGDGAIHSDLPVATSGARREHDLRGKLNAGGPLLSVRANDGSVRLGRI